MHSTQLFFHNPLKSEFGVHFYFLNILEIGYQAVSHAME